MGWDTHFQAQLEHFSSDSLIPARVVGVRKNSFRTSNGKSEWFAVLAGRLKYDADGMYPVTGDWVLMTDSAGRLPSGKLIKESKLHFLILKILVWCAVLQTAAIPMSPAAGFSGQSMKVKSQGTGWKTTEK